MTDQPLQLDTSRWAPELPWPIDSAAHLKEAFTVVRSLRDRAPEMLYRWEPEWELAPAERPRREMVLALVLVQALGTGNGGYEARITACKKIYQDGGHAPAEAVRAAELLLRSRMVTGATDLETFWLTAAFAHPLSPMVPQAVADLAWRYLTQAPMFLDTFSAIEFVRASRPHRTSRRPWWPWELASELPEGSRELAVTLLEALLCVSLRARSIEEVAASMPLKGRERSALVRRVVLALAGHYERAGNDSGYARSVLEQAAIFGDRPAELYLEEQVFDLPHEALLAELVTSPRREERADDLHERATAAGKYHVARRLTEAELVLRLAGAARGPAHARLELGLERLFQAPAAEGEPRLRELLLRAGILYSRTRHYTPAARSLVRYLAERPELTEEPTLRALRGEFDDFLRECDPRRALEDAQARVQERLAQLPPAAGGVLEEAHHFIGERFQLRSEVVERAARVVSAPLGLLLGGALLQPLSLAIEQSLARLTRLGGRLVDVAELGARVESRLTGAPPDLDDVVLRRAMARELARMDRMAAGLGGAVAGLLGGPWGATLDLMTLLALSARAVARIGVCYGILPGTPEGFRLLSGSLALASSSDGGEGLLLVLRAEQRRRVRRVRIGRMLYAGQQVAYWARGTSAEILAQLARQVGFSLGERQLVRFIPVVGAALAAGADYLFVKAVGEAAVNVGARMYLMDRVEADTAEPEEGDLDLPSPGEAPPEQGGH